MSFERFISVAEDLEDAGLVWSPEIGDEISFREKREVISILVDPQGLTPNELRDTYIWLPTLEQLVLQLESRQAILFHAGLDLTEGSMFYKAVIQSQVGPIESKADSLRSALGLGLRDLLLQGLSEVH